jgi:hypothetical protein
MAEIRLQGARVGALVGKLKTAGVPEDVWMRLEAKLGLARVKPFGEPTVDQSEKTRAPPRAYPDRASRVPTTRV